MINFFVYVVPVIHAGHPLSCSTPLKAIHTSLESPDLSLVSVGNARYVNIQFLFPRSFNFLTVVK